MNATVQAREFDGLGTCLANRMLRVDPLDLPGFRDVRRPPPFRIAVNFHPEAGFFAAIVVCKR